jgi:hypothetical protein
LILSSFPEEHPTKAKIKTIAMSNVINFFFMIFPPERWLYYTLRFANSSSYIAKYAAKATNVISEINGKAITEIFKSNGITVKKA